MVMAKGKGNARSSINKASFKSYTVDEIDKRTSEEDRQARIRIAQNQNRKEVKFVPGELVYIYTDIKGLGMGFYEFEYERRIGHNIFFLRATPSGCILTSSFRVTDYELGLVRIYTKAEYKQLKKLNALREIEKWQREERKREYGNREIKAESGDSV